MKDTIHEAGLHSAAKMYAAEYGEGKLSRREFLTRTTALGVSAAACGGSKPEPASQASVDDLVDDGNKAPARKSPPSSPLVKEALSNSARLAGATPSVSPRTLVAGNPGTWT